MTLSAQNSTPANIQDRQIAVLRAWHGVDTGSLWDFPEEERLAALRAVYAVSRAIDAEVSNAITDRLEDMREHEEPSLHSMLFSNDTRFVLNVIRAGV